MDRKSYYLLSAGVALFLLALLSLNETSNNQGEISELDVRINDIEWKLEQ